MFNRVVFVGCFLALLLSRYVISVANSEPQDHASDELIRKTLDSLEKLALFFNRNVDKLNLDSVCGIRMAEGSLALITDNSGQDVGIEEDINHNAEYLSRTKTLLKSLRKAANDAQPFLKEYQPDYYTLFKPIVRKAWSYFRSFDGTSYDTSNATQYPNAVAERNHVTFSEKASDKCMSEIMGTAAGQQSRCLVSDKCMELMTSPALQGYANTHQILYFLIGFQHGCRHTLEKRLKEFQRKSPRNNIPGNVDSFLKQKCDQIFREMKELKATVQAIPGERDLFMEQGLICGMFGFKRFMSLKILQNIFGWQDDQHGCFGRENQKQSYGEEGTGSRNTMRKLLYDRTLPNGCSSHETGVATGLLSVYLRWLLTA